MGKRYFIYGSLGWCLEVFWTGLGSLLGGDIKLTSHTYIWMFFIYGLAVILEPIHERIRNWPVLLRGGVYAIVCFAIEFSTGLFLRIVLGVCPWDYSQSPLSVMGLIRLDFVAVWFCAGLLFEKVHDYLLSLEALRKVA